MRGILIVTILAVLSGCAVGPDPAIYSLDQDRLDLALSSGDETEAARIFKRRLEQAIPPALKQHGYHFDSFVVDTTAPDSFAVRLYGRPRLQDLPRGAKTELMTNLAGIVGYQFSQIGAMRMVTFEGKSRPVKLVVSLTAGPNVLDGRRVGSVHLPEGNVMVY